MSKTILAVLVAAAANTFYPDQLSTVEGFVANHGG
jgi:hypothetical protein